VKQQILAMCSNTSRSSKPAIYGIVAAAEVERLRPLSQGDTSHNEVSSLELAAAEMAQAAAELVAKEREILSMRSKGADAKLVTGKEQQRGEAAANLERKMAAMEAVLAARRTIMVEPSQDEAKKPPSVAQMMEQMKPATLQRTSAGPGCGSGYEILYQGFNWESCKVRDRAVLWVGGWRNACSAVGARCLPASGTRVMEHACRRDHMARVGLW
jgi:alpha-amylase